ncbi:hypothetical protein IU11_00415 [Cellulosimicrobium sp. MM]|nr:hypothetical protein IU11_00415 [Cellulosimicrobium sp. MM]
MASSVGSVEGSDEGLAVGLRGLLGGARAVTAPVGSGRARPEQGDRGRERERRGEARGAGGGTTGGDHGDSSVGDGCATIVVRAGTSRAPNRRRAAGS